MLNVLQTAARKAGKVLLDYFQKEVKTAYKASHQSLLTEADLAAQKVIYDSLLKSMIKKGYKNKDLGFIGEENLNIEGRHRFIIDPLDGTTNFASGINYFCVSIAYVKSGLITAGVVFDPNLDIFYLAQKGKGAQKKTPNKSQRLKVRKTSLRNCLVAYHLTSKADVRDKHIKALAKLFPHVRQMRVMGSATLDTCHVADNVFGGYINSNCYIWDIAAANLVVEEAGGAVVDFKGKEVNYDFKKPGKSYQTIASHHRNLAQILSYF